jgi:DNA-binding response OmpR family regulator
MSPAKGIRILSICDDEGIRFSRELVLKQEGYEVESVRSDEDVDDSRIKSFHIAVLCHSLSPEDAARMTIQLREANSTISVLRVHAIRSMETRFYDVDCEVLPGPGQLLSGIQVLCTRLKSQPEQGQRKLA